MRQGVLGVDQPRNPVTAPRESVGYPVRWGQKGRAERRPDEAPPGLGSAAVIWYVYAAVLGADWTGTEVTCGGALSITGRSDVWVQAAVARADWFDADLNPKLQSFAQHYGAVVRRILSTLGLPLGYAYAPLYPCT
jgi:hypothetical protein